VNRALKRMSVAILVMFLLLMINVNYLQGFDTGKLAALPFNSRTLENQVRYQRGEILTADGKVIAKSVPSNDFYKWQRVYPYRDVYAPVTGFYSLYGATGGIEQADDSVLAGGDSSLAVRNFIDMITGKQRKGANVQTTIVSSVQQAAYDGLQSKLQGTGFMGGVVAIEPSTGKILALASYPSYDPNKLAVHDGKQLNINDAATQGAPGQPRRDHAINDLFPPGSTFKIVTSSAFFNQDGTRNAQTSVASPSQLTFSDTTSVLTNDQGEVCGNGSGQAPIIVAFAQSCDTTFGKIGEDLGTGVLNSTAAAFGMNSDTLTIPMPVTQSNYVQAPGPSTTAFSAIGQYSDTVTPLQEAMFSAAIANGGQLMKPYLVQTITAGDYSKIQETTPSTLGQAVSSQVASEVSQMMQAVVQTQQGTAFGFNQNAEGGVNISGKTGTAQNGVNNSHLDDAVFTAFAPGNGNPKIAVGVILQGGGYGATAAAPIAVQVIKAYLAYLQGNP